MRLLCLLFAFFLMSSAVICQTNSSEPVVVIPGTISFSGILPNPDAAPKEIFPHFAFFAEKDGNSPLWSEDQAVWVQSNGSYTVLLGLVSSGGIPPSLFASGDPRWIGVSLDGVEVGPRTLMVSVPYAMKAADADTLGGLPPAAFVTWETLNKSATAVTNPQATSIINSAALGNSVAGSLPEVGGEPIAKQGTKFFGNIAATTVSAAITDKGGQVHNAKAYGATGNGTGINDCSGIAAAFAARDAAGGGQVLIPAGNYIVGATCRITTTTPGLITGAGMCNLDNSLGSASTCGTRIASSDSTGVFLSVATEGVTVRDIGFVNTAATLTSGAPLRSTSTAYLQQMNLESVSCAGFYDCAEEWVGATWHITKSYFSLYTHCGIDVQNMLALDSGDGQIEGNEFASSVAGNVGVCYESGAGLKISGNKFVGSWGATGMTNAIMVNQSGGSGQTLILNNDIDGTNGPGINLVKGYNYTIIANNYIAPEGNNSAIVCSGALAGLYIGGGYLGAPPGTPNISAANCQGVITPYAFNSNNTTANVVNPKLYDSSNFGSGSPTFSGNLTVGSSTTAQLTLDSSNSGTTYPASITASFQNGTTGGMSFTLPRNLTGFGYNFWNQGQTRKLFYIDSTSGKVNSQYQTLDDGSRNAQFLGNGTFNGGSLLVGCSAAVTGASCPTTSTLSLDSSYAGSYYPSSVTSSFLTKGMVFTLPRNLSGFGYYFRNSGGTSNLAVIDSVSGNLGTR